MPFWKKSEDPWDVEPKKSTRPAAPVSKDKDDAPGLVDELRDWNQERKEKKRRRETPPPPMACPWCGQEMELGYLTGGRGVFWIRGLPTAKKLWLGAGRDDTMRLDVGGGLASYQTAWFCQACQKIVVEAAGIHPLGEGYVGLSLQTEEGRPQEELEQE